MPCLVAESDISVCAVQVLDNELPCAQMATWLRTWAPQHKCISACGLTSEREDLAEVVSDDEWVQEVRMGQAQQLMSCSDRLLRTVLLQR